MSLHKEVSFETEIGDYLGSHGWLYAEDDQDYDRARALYPADVVAWVQATQPKAWEALTKNHGAQAGQTLLARVRDQLDQRGTLDVLRHGVELLGLKQTAEAGGVQAGAGDQCGDPRPLCGEPVARRAAGALLGA